MTQRQKKVIYLDMDDVIADFFNSAKDKTNTVDEGLMYTHDFFFNLKPVSGAVSNVRRILNLGFDVWILTQPLANWAPSYSEKVRWINIHFPELTNKIIMTQDKGLMVGHYLIDDNDVKWKAKFEKNGGKFVHFAYDRECPCPVDHEKKWAGIYQFFLNEDSTYEI